MPDLLLELFSEEIPARMQARAAEDLRKAVTDRLLYVAGVGGPKSTVTDTLAPTEIENDASPAAVFTASPAAVGHLPKLSPFRWTNNKRCGHAFQHSFPVSALQNSLH